jgi:HAE1 family hydrophobic/amphiphilic exporter-1
MKTNLPKLAMQRPITVAMVVVTVIGLGIITARRTPVDFLPALDLPFLAVFIPYPGATPEQVEQEITIPAEGEFRTLSSLNQLYSQSSGDGATLMFLFDWGTDMPQALADVRDRIERVRLVLPDAASQIWVRHFSSDTLPVMQIGLSRAQTQSLFPNPLQGDAFAQLARTDLLPRLKRLPDIAEIQLWGGDESAIMIELDQHALSRQQLSIYQLVNTLQESNVDTSVGALIDGRSKYFVRALGQFEGPEDLFNFNIAQGLRLKDVAGFDFRSREVEQRYEIDGEPQLFLLVTKKAGANSVAACQAVLDEIEQTLTTPAYAGVKHYVFFNQGEVILSALNGLRMSGAYGGAMALIVLLLFLRRLRPTVVVSLAIPGSLLVAFIYMYFYGMTLNLISMMSFIIAIGMVIDNSIVVMENIYRYEKLGLSPKESAHRGASEVALAILAATSTTAVVFVPVIFMQNGEMAIFTKNFAVPVTVALGASLLIALTVIPVALGHFRHGKLDTPVVPRPKPTPSRFNPGPRMMTAYITALRAATRWRLAALLLLAAVIWVSIEIPLKGMGSQNTPAVDRRQITIEVDFDNNYDLAMADDVFGQLESVLSDRREELGIKHVFKNYSARGGSFTLFLNPPGADAPYSSEDVMSILWYLLPERIPGGELEFQSQADTLVTTGGKGQVSIRIMGDDMAVLERYAERFATEMEALPSIIEAKTGIERVQKEIQLHVDEVLADRAGITPAMIAQTVGFALLGTRMPDYIQDGREIPVWTQFREADRKTRANLDNVLVLGETGRLIPLNQLVTTKKVDTPRSISRLDGKNYVQVSAHTSSKDMAALQADMQHIAGSFELPPGYSISLGEEFEGLEENLNNFFTSLILAIFLIYIVMSALFESTLLPLSILTSVPLAFIGVVWAMYLTHTPLDTVSFIGCILMVGVIVNNGIVIVDHINTLRRTGLERTEAIIQAGRDRIRPVLMTAITTILGALPIAIGGTPGRDAVVGLGRAMIGGLAAGTLLTLFVVPLFYLFIDDVRTWSLRLHVPLGRRHRESVASDGT